MSFHDVCELGSLLQGDDTTRDDMRRKILTIQSAIEMQEARLQHEGDQKLHLHKEEQKYATKARNLKDELESLILLLTQLTHDNEIDAKTLAFLSTIVNYEASRSSLLKEIDLLLNTMDMIDEDIAELRSFQELNANESNDLIQTELSEKKRRCNDVTEHVSKLESNLVESNAAVINLSQTCKERREVNDKLVVQERDHRAKYAGMKSEGVNRIKQLQHREEKLSGERETIDVRSLELAARLATATTTEATMDTEIALRKQSLNELEAKEMTLEDECTAIAGVIAEKSKRIAEKIITKENISDNLSKLLKRQHDRRVDTEHELFRSTSFRSRVHDLQCEVHKVVAENEQLLMIIDDIRSQVDNYCVKIEGRDIETSEILKSIEHSVAKKKRLLDTISFKKNEISDLEEAMAIKTARGDHMIQEMRRVQEELRAVIRDNQELSVDEVSRTQDMATLNDITSSLEAKAKLFEEDSIVTPSISDNERDIARLEKIREEQSGRRKSANSMITLQLSKQMQDTYKKHRDQQTANARREALTKKRSDLQALRQTLSSTDRDFQQQFLQKERELQEVETKLMEDMKIIRATYDDSLRDGKRHRPQNSEGSTDRVDLEGSNRTVVKSSRPMNKTSSFDERPLKRRNYTAAVSVASMLDQPADKLSKNSRTDMEENLFASQVKRPESTKSAGAKPKVLSIRDPNSAFFNPTREAASQSTARMRVIKK